MAQSAGKTWIGELLAERLACCFVVDDTFHSTANKVEMAGGVGTQAESEPHAVSWHVCAEQQAEVAGDIERAG